jgi:hypothetical protein
VEVATTSPATELEARAKPARLIPVALIRARNCRRDISLYAFASQSSTIDTSLLNNAACQNLTTENQENILISGEQIHPSKHFGKSAKLSRALSGGPFF